LFIEHKFVLYGTVQPTGQVLWKIYFEDCGWCCSIFRVWKIV